MEENENNFRKIFHSEIIKEGDIQIVKQVMENTKKPRKVF